jgi:hypothetical protein
VQVAPAVNRLSAIFRNGTTLTLHPVTLRACGQQLHLAEFACPASGVTHWRPPCPTARPSRSPRSPPAARGYLALALPSGTTLTRLTLRNRSGHAFATVTSIPPAG